MDVQILAAEVVHHLDIFFSLATVNTDPTIHVAVVASRLKRILAMMRKFPEEHYALQNMLKAAGYDTAGELFPAAVTWTVRKQQVRVFIPQHLGVNCCVVNTVLPVKQSVGTVLIDAWRPARTLRLKGWGGSSLVAQLMEVARVMRLLADPQDEVVDKSIRTAAAHNAAHNPSGRSPPVQVRVCMDVCV